MNASMNASTKSIDTNLILGKPGSHPWGVESADELLTMMDRHGVERGLVSHIASSIHDARVGNRLLFSALDQSNPSRERLHPVPVVRLRDLPTEEVWREWRSLGVRCVRVCPGFYREQAAPGESVGQLGDALERAGLFLQVSLAPFYGSPWTSATVSDAARLAPAIAPVQLLLSGISRSHYTELEALLSTHANALVDVGNLTTGTGVQSLVGSGFEDRLVWGSGFGISYARQFADVIATSGIPDAAVEKILGGNARSLIGA